MKDVFTIPEIRQILASLREIYDIVRVVDPIRNLILEFPENRDEPVAQEYHCYAVWNKEQRCENCISVCAFKEKARKTKYEFIDYEVYSVVSKYIEVRGRGLVLEIVCRNNDEVLLGAFGHNEFVDRIVAHNRALHTDALTGAYNRRYLNERPRVLDKVDGICRCSFAMLDIDNFKDVNDTWGHAAGDEALIALVKLLQSHIRPKNSDCVFRYGGDEFVLLMSGVRHDVFRRRMEQVLSDINALSFAAYPGLKLGISIGGASQCERKDASYEELIALADKRMYDAKAAGGNRLSIPLITEDGLGAC